MAKAVKEIDEKKFNELRQERLPVTPREGFVVLCLERPGGDYIQYAGIVIEKTFQIGVAPLNKVSGLWPHPAITAEGSTPAVLVSGGADKIIPFTLKEDGLVYSYCSDWDYGPKEPYGFLLGPTHAEEMLGDKQPNL